MALALAALIVPADLTVQADRLVVLTVDQVFGVVVPFQLQILAHQHAVGLIDLTVLVRQQIQLGVGSKIEVFDVVALLFGVHSVNMNRNFLAVSVCIVIIAAPPLRFPIDLNFGTIRCLAEVFEFTRLFTGVVVLLGLFVFGTRVGNIGGVLGDPLLLLQSLDQLILAHIFVGHSRGKVLDDLLFLLADVRDLQVTDPELLALLQLNGFYLLLQLLVQPFLCVLQVLVGLYGICHGDSLTDRRVDLQGLFAQVAVVDGNGGFADLVGGSLSSGIQSDLTIGFRELRSQHGLDSGFIQVLFFPKSKGVGDGLVAILLGGGVGAVRVLLQVLVGFAVLGREGSARQGPGVVYESLVKGFLRRLGLAGPSLHGPAGFSDRIKLDVTDGVTLGLQLINGFASGGGKSIPGGLFLLESSEGDGCFSKGVDGLGDAAVVVLGGHGVDGRIVCVDLDHIGVIGVGPLRHGTKDGIGGNKGGRIIALLALLGPGDSAAGDVGGAGHGGLLHVLGVLAVHGSLGRLRFSMRVGNFGILILEGVGDGLAVLFPGDGQSVACKVNVLQLILSEGDVILPGSLPQGVLDGLGLGGGFGFVLSAHLVEGLVGLLDLDLIAQGVTLGFHLLNGQLFTLVVHAILVAGKVFAQTISQLLVGKVPGLIGLGDGVLPDGDAVLIGDGLSIDVGAVVLFNGGGVLEDIFQLPGGEKDFFGLLVIDVRLLDRGVQFHGALFGALVHPDLQGGLGGGLHRIPGDLVHRGTGADDLALLVQDVLGLFQGIGAVLLFVQVLALVHQLGDILGRKVLFLPGLGLFQGQLLGVAVLRGLGLLDGIAVVLGLFFLVLPGFGVHAVPGQLRAVLAQLLVQVDLALLLVLLLIAGLLGLGLGLSLCLAGALVGGDLGTRGGGAAVGVGGGLAHLYLSGGGVGVHGLGLGGLTDLARLASLLILLAGVDDVALGDGGVGVLGVRLGVLVVDLYILRLRIRGKGRLLVLFGCFLIHRASTWSLPSGAFSSWPFRSAPSSKAALGSASLPSGSAGASTA